jgi:hypothetical protein
LAGTFPQPVIQDLIDMNKAVEVLKTKPELTVKIQHIEPDKIRFGCVSDASWANAEENKSQGGDAIITFDKALLTGARAKCNLINWHSGRIHQVVNSTLAAETRSLSRTLATLTWYVCLYEEMTNANFRLEQWHDYIKQRSTQMLMKNNVDPRLKQRICIVDAKSLYDHLSKETAGGNDKRTAIEMQIIRQSMSELNCQIRWIPHQEMIVDALTKRDGNRTPLYRLLESGQLQLTGEEDMMMQRAADKENGVKYKR